jgi:hypothetical protein
MSRATMGGFVLLLLFWSPLEADEPVKAAFEPTSSYVERRVEGWRVLIHPRLLGEEQALGDRVLRELEYQLYQIGRHVPAKAVERLRSVPIWLEVDEPHHPCAAYHPGRGWLVAHGMNPDKAKCVEIANARTFLDWTRIQPWMVFHELAHAYHDQFLEAGYANPTLRTLHDQAKAGGTYSAVLHSPRDQPEKAYALNNPQEYFAEGSEAFFGLNDFYPFNRLELARHDPRLHEAMFTLWGVEVKR